MSKVTHQCGKVTPIYGPWYYCMKLHQSAKCSSKGSQGTGEYVFEQWYIVYHQLRARRALSILKDVLLRTRRVLLLHNVYMVIVPFWFSTEYLWTVLVSFCLSTDDIVYKIMSKLSSSISKKWKLLWLFFFFIFISLIFCGVGINDAGIVVYYSGGYCL